VRATTAATAIVTGIEKVATGRRIVWPSLQPLPGATSR
jgi:hypothetical protein